MIRQWRNQWADKPRTADYGMQVLSRLLGHAVDPLGRIAGNPCEGIKRLYSGGEIIWTDADIAQEIAHAVDLAAYTGLRRGYLIRLCWSHVGEHGIVIATDKSRHRVEVVIPIYDALRSHLDSIPKRSTTILTTSLGRPWTANGFSSAVQRTKAAAGMNDRNLHWHDLRGTAATRFYTEIMGWEEDHVSKIMSRYVGRSAATRAIIAQLNRVERET